MQQPPRSCCRGFAARSSCLSLLLLLLAFETSVPSALSQPTSIPLSSSAPTTKNVSAIVSDKNVTSYASAVATLKNVIDAYADKLATEKTAIETAKVDQGSKAELRALAADKASGNVTAAKAQAEAIISAALANALAGKCPNGSQPISLKERVAAIAASDRAVRQALKKELDSKLPTLSIQIGDAKTSAASQKAAKATAGVAQKKADILNATSSVWGPALTSLFNGIGSFGSAKIAAGEAVKNGTRTASGSIPTAPGRRRRRLVSSSALDLENLYATTDDVSGLLTDAAEAYADSLLVGDVPVGDSKLDVSASKEAKEAVVRGVLTHVWTVVEALNPKACVPVPPTPTPSPPPPPTTPPPDPCLPPNTCCQGSQVYPPWSPPSKPQCVGAATPSPTCDDLSVDPKNCGSCGNVCPASASTCCSGSCKDLGTDVSNCGSCGTACPVPPNTIASCSGGKCDFTCKTGFANCNGDPSDGCETNINTDANNCGACKNVCGGSSTCQSGQCSCLGTVCPDNAFCSAQGCRCTNTGNLVDTVTQNGTQDKYYCNGKTVQTYDLGIIKGDRCTLYYDSFTIPDRFVFTTGSVCNNPTIDTGYVGLASSGCKESAPCCEPSDGPQCKGTGANPDVCPSDPKAIPPPGGGTGLGSDTVAVTPGATAYVTAFGVCGGTRNVFNLICCNVADLDKNGLCPSKNPPPLPNSC